MSIIGNTKYYSQSAIDAIIEEQIRIAQNFMENTYLTDEVLSGEKHIEKNKVINELLKLKDKGKNPIIGYNENDEIDDESKQVINKTIEQFQETCKEYKESDLFEDPIIYDRIIKDVQEIQEIIKNKKSEKTINDKIVNNDVVSFITIPITNEISILDNDLIGKDSTITKKLTANSPHGYDFVKKRGKKDASQTFLYELDKIEDNLHDGTIIETISGEHEQFKRENNRSYAKRNLSKKIRIHLMPITVDKQKCITILGLYYKEGNNDEKVNGENGEYKNRCIILNEIIKTSGINLKNWEKAYENFKKRLIVMQYGDTISQLDALEKYITSRKKKKHII